MRQLFWKEWREQRRLPLIATAVMIVMNGIWALSVSRMHLQGAHGGSQLSLHGTINGTPVTHVPESMAIIVGGSGVLLAFVWIMMAIFTGAGSVAAEIGHGTLPFLLSLPVRREALWRIKVLTAIGTLLASVLASSVAWYTMDTILYGSGFTHLTGIFVQEKFSDICVPILATVFLALFFALMISTLVDRAVSALLATIVIAPVAYGFLSAGAEWSVHHLFPHIKSAQVDAGCLRCPRW